MFQFALRPEHDELLLLPMRDHPQAVSAPVASLNSNFTCY